VGRAPPLWPGGIDLRRGQVPAPRGGEGNQHLGHLETEGWEEKNEVFLCQPTREQCQGAQGEIGRCLEGNEVEETTGMWTASSPRNRRPGEWVGTQQSHGYTHSKGRSKKQKKIVQLGTQPKVTEPTTKTSRPGIEDTGPSQSVRAHLKTKRDKQRRGGKEKRGWPGTRDPKKPARRGRKNRDREKLRLTPRPKDPSPKRRKLLPNQDYETSPTRETRDCSQQQLGPCAQPSKKGKGTKETSPEPLSKKTHKRQSPQLEHANHRKISAIPFGAPLEKAILSLRKW